MTQTSPIISLVNGKNSVNVDSRDPYYSSFFSSMREILSDGETLPSSLTVPSYVLEQWDSWLVLRDWIERGPRIFYGDIGASIIPPARVPYRDDDPDDMAALQAMIEACPNVQPALLAIAGQVTQGPSLLSGSAMRSHLDLPLVSLEEVRAIMGFLIEAPTEWILYVSVRNWPNPQERLATIGQ